MSRCNSRSSIKVREYEICGTRVAATRGPDTNITRPTIQAQKELGTEIVELSNKLQEGRLTY
jgi:hypothetical protein